MDALAINLAYSYVGDISHGASNRSASFHLLIIETLLFRFSTLGIQSSNYIFQSAGYIWFFTSITTLCGMSAIYTLVFIPNIIPHREECESDKEEEKTLLMKLYRILRDLVSSITKRRSGHGRSTILILIAVLGTHAISYTCDSTISFVFLQTQRNLYYSIHPVCSHWGWWPSDDWVDPVDRHQCDDHWVDQLPQQTWLLP